MLFKIRFNSLFNNSAFFLEYTKSINFNCSGVKVSTGCICSSLKTKLLLPGEIIIPSLYFKLGILFISGTKILKLSLIGY